MVSSKSTRPLTNFLCLANLILCLPPTAEINLDCGFESDKQALRDRRDGEHTDTQTGDERRGAVGCVCGKTAVCVCEKMSQGLKERGPRGQTARWAQAEERSESHWGNVRVMTLCFPLNPSLLPDHSTDLNRLLSKARCHAGRLIDRLTDGSLSVCAHLFALHGWKPWWWA